jgi:hypothetical protein
MIDITPILNLFQQLPDGWWKVVLLTALFISFGALITHKTLTHDDYFIWWDD